MKKKIYRITLCVLAAIIAAIPSGCAGTETLDSAATEELFTATANADFLLFGSAGEEVPGAVNGRLPLAFKDQDGMQYECTAQKGQTFSYHLFVYAGKGETTVRAVEAGELWAPEEGGVAAGEVQVRTELPLVVREGAMGCIELSVDLPKDLPNGIYREIVRVKTGDADETQREMRFEITVTGGGADEMITLADGGVSQWSLVHKTVMSPSEEFAVAEFARLFKQMTGADILMKDEKEPAAPHEIVVGTGTRSAEAGFGQRTDELGDDGFIIESGGDRVYILGSEVRGTLYGVYTFFEDYFGFMWPDSKTVVAPERKTAVIPAVSRTDIPALQYRESFYTDAFEWEFAARNRSNGASTKNGEQQGGKLTYAGFVHTMNQLVPVEYFDDHPEYFAERGGIRTGGDTQRCLTNPDVLRITVENVKKLLAETPGVKYVSVSQNDNQQYCTCKNCAAVDAEEGSHSGTLIRFVNAVADAIRNEYPDVLVDTLAYQYTRNAPRITKPAENVIIRLCSIECCFSHTLTGCTWEIPTDTEENVQVNASFVEDLEDWAAITGKLFVWDYTVNFRHYHMPFPNLYVLRDNIRTMEQNNVTGIFEQGCYTTLHGECSELKAWMIAKFLWNADYPTELAMNEFTCAYYDRAGAPILEYLHRLNSAAAETDVHCTIFGGPSYLIFTEEYIGYGRRLFDDAVRLAGNDEYLRRVKIAELAYRYAALAMDETRTRGEVDKKVDALVEDMKAFGITQVGEGRDMGYGKSDLYESIYRS